MLQLNTYVCLKYFAIIYLILNSSDISLETIKKRCYWKFIFKNYYILEIQTFNNNFFKIIIVNLYILVVLLSN